MNSDDLHHSDPVDAHALIVAQRQAFSAVRAARIAAAAAAHQLAVASHNLDIIIAVVCQRMIPKGGNRFSKKIVLQEQVRA